MDIFEMIGTDSLQQVATGLARLIIAAVCGAIIGINRERRRRPAGLRTHMLVCLGAALVMITNEQIALSGYDIDVTRMGAQVISGIGFLGAGTIIVDRKNHVRGLTTAASLWTSAGIGLAIGSGYYLGGLFACLLTLLIVSAFWGLERKLGKTAETLDLYVEFEASAKLYAFLSRMIALNYEISSFTTAEPEQCEEHAAARISLKSRAPGEQHSILGKLEEFEGIVCLRET